MNLSEFKAWFEGFTEAMDGPPNAKAWKRIKEQVGKIVAMPSTYQTIIREYPRYSPYRPYPISTWGITAVGSANNAQMPCSNQVTNSAPETAAVQVAHLFYQMGKADAEVIN